MAPLIQVKREPESLLHRNEVDWQWNAAWVTKNQGGYGVGMNEQEPGDEWVTHHTYTLQRGAATILGTASVKSLLCQWLNSIKP